MRATTTTTAPRPARGRTQRYRPRYRDRRAIITASGHYYAARAYSAASRSAGETAPLALDQGQVAEPVLSLRLIASAQSGACHAQIPQTPQATPRAAPSRARAARGGFFHIQVRPRTEFVSFRNQDVGSRGGIERVAGRRANGSWDTQKWLVGKNEAHLDGKTARARQRRPRARCSRSSARYRAISAATASSPSRAARSRRSEKPTPAMRRAQLANIKKAQAAVRKRRRARA